MAYLAYLGGEIAIITLLTGGGALEGLYVSEVGIDALFDAGAGGGVGVVYGWGCGAGGHAGY